MSAPRAYGGPGAPWEPQCVGLQSHYGDSPLQVAHNDRMGIQSKHFLTVVRPEDADWIVRRLAGRYEGRVVVEIGAGIGILATRLAEKARHVYAIEADPCWNLIYAKFGAVPWGERPPPPEMVPPGTFHRPTNLTWIFGMAQDLIGALHADLAICVTGSDEPALYELCKRFASDVCMPWQDWEHGMARVPWFLGTPAEPVPR